MLLPTWLLAVLAATQLPTHVITSPLPDTGGLHGASIACIEDHGLTTTCEAWPARVFSNELVDSRVKRGLIPLLPAKPEPIPLVGPKTGADPAQPFSGGPEPIPITGPKPDAAPADPFGGNSEPIVVSVKPTAAPEATAAPKPEATQGPQGNGQGEQPAPQGNGQGGQPSSIADDANEPQGNLNGNDPNFNGYAVTGPNKAVTALDDAIRTNKPDVQVPKFDEELDNPLKPGEKFTKYKPAEVKPNLNSNGEPKFDIASNVHVETTRFQDPDINLPINNVNPDGREEPGALWATVKIQSARLGPDETSADFNADVVELAANKDGTVIYIKNTDATQDFSNDAKDNVPDILKKTSSSELIVQAAGLVRGAKFPASALRVIVRKTVINEGTINTLRTAYQRNGLAIDQKGVFRASAPKNTPEGQAFDALMQTKNLEVSNFILADHHQKFGDKIIKEIITFPASSFGNVGDINANADIFLILGGK